MSQSYQHTQGRLVTLHAKWEKVDPAKRMRYTALIMGLVLFALMGLLFILVQTGVVKVAGLSAFAKALTGKSQVKQSMPGGN